MSRPAQHLRGVHTTTYGFGEFDTLVPAYAATIHKSQGSEYPAVIIPIMTIAMITQAALERSTVPEHRRNSAFVYVDEAQEYFDDSIETILNQARKYHVGLTLAHQTLDQLSPRLRSAILANTSMKCAGGVSAKDARVFADELHTTSDFIESMKRHGPRSEFAVWVKNLTGKALRLTVPLGFLSVKRRWIEKIMMRSWRTIASAIAAR